MHAFDGDPALHRQVRGDRRIDPAGQHDHRLAADADRITAGTRILIGHDVRILLMHLDLDLHIRRLHIDLPRRIAQDVARHGAVDLVRDHRKLLPAPSGRHLEGPLFILLGQRQRRRLDRFDIAVAANRERERADAEHLLQIRLYLKRILAVEMDVHAVMGLFIVQRRKSAQRVFHVIEQLLDEILAVLSLRGKLAIADQDMIVNKVILWHNLL